MAQGSSTPNAEYKELSGHSFCTKCHRELQHVTQLSAADRFVCKECARKGNGEDRVRSQSTESESEHLQILKFPSQPSCPPSEESDSSKLELYSSPLQETGNTQGKSELVHHNNINSMPGFTDDGDIPVHHFNSIHETDLLEVFSWTDIYIMQQKSFLPPVLHQFTELMEANDLQLQ